MSEPLHIWQYKVTVYREPLLGSMVFGGSKVDPERFSAFLNKNGAHGWEVVTMEREIRREFLFFKREAFVTIMKRAVAKGSTSKDTSPAIS